jgi:hypothetical protein
MVEKLPNGKYRLSRKGVSLLSMSPGLEEKIANVKSTVADPTSKMRFEKMGFDIDSAEDRCAIYQAVKDHYEHTQKILPDFDKVFFVLKSFYHLRESGFDSKSIYSPYSNQNDNESYKARAAMKAMGLISQRGYNTAPPPCRLQE